MACCVKSISIKAYSVDGTTVDSVDRFGKYLLLVLSEYYSGQHDMAYSLFKESIQSCIDLDMFLRELPQDMVFYRCRKKKPNTTYTARELFHIPFSSRYMVSVQRYSYPGLPCLYLGSSQEVCAAELSSESDELVAAKIRYHTSGPRYKILDLTSLFDNCVTRLQEEIAERILKNIPLVLVCSTVINYDLIEGDKIGFRQEYIFPQLLLEYVLNETLLSEDTVLGIKYFSSKFDFISSWIDDDFRKLQSMCNYVFPARETKSPTDYCTVLEDCFEITAIENN